jgi:ABC-type sugar transport system substrate-binding protein
MSSAPKTRYGPRWRRLLRFVGVAALVACAAGLVVACGSDASSAGTTSEPAATGASAPEVGKINDYTLPKVAKPSKRYKVVLLQAHRSDAFAISSAWAVEQAGRQDGVEVIVNDAGGYQNVSKQIDQIEAAILEKPDALIIWSTDPTAISPALEKAKAAGIKVVGYVQPPTAKTEFTVNGDFALDGQTMARSLFTKMGGKGKAMVILGGAGSAYQAALKKGWDTALADFPGIDVVADQTIPDFDPSKVQSAVENQLVRNPDLGGVMTTTTAMAASASDALTAGGRAGKAFAVGQILGDCSQIRLLKQDRLSIVLGVPAVYYGRLVMANTIDMLEGGHPKKATVVPGNVYTPANIDEAPLDLEIAPQFLKGCSK